MNKRQISIAFRDGINKITGKQTLIDQYNKAVAALSRKSDSLHGTNAQKDLLEKLDSIMESETYEDEHGGFGIKSFNPYLITSTKSKIKTKINMLKQLMKEYRIK